MTIIIVLPGFTLLIVAQASEIEKKAEKVSADNDKTNNVAGEYDSDNKKTAAFSDPFVSPNPVGPEGRVYVTVNNSENKAGIDFIRLDIQGPNIGSTNPRLTPTSIGSLPLHPASRTAQDGMWTTSFHFPNSLPDGNYLYSLTITDKMGNVTKEGPYSGIILDRHQPDPADTAIVTAVDGNGKTISKGGITRSPNITFTFQGTDKTGVIQLFQCNLDDVIMGAENGHGEGESVLSTYSPCFTPTEIAARIAGNYAYTNLGAGNHTFKVRAVDNEYDFDASPSTFSWTILPPHLPTNVSARIAR